MIKAYKASPVHQVRRAAKEMPDAMESMEYQAVQDLKDLEVCTHALLRADSDLLTCIDFAVTSYETNQTRTILF